MTPLEKIATAIVAGWCTGGLIAIAVTLWRLWR